MLTILLGPDGYSKKEYIKTLAAKEKAEVVVLVEPQELPMGQLVGQDLFMAKKVFVLEQAVKLIQDHNLQSLIDSKNQILLLEEKLDKRLSFNKQLLANKLIEVKQFALPHGKELNKWIENRVKELGGKIESSAVELLAVFLGRDDAKETKFGGKVVDVEEVYNLLEADSEINKLLALAGSEIVTTEMVKQLVPQRQEAGVFDIVNAIGENDRKKAYHLLEIFLASESAADEKGKIIQLNALLSEQFRNVGVVQDFLSRQVPDAEILQKTEWKSGRLFVMKKIASKFPPKKVWDLLNKLNLLDEELKTTSTPPRVLLDLIFSQF